MVWQRMLPNAYVYGKFVRGGLVNMLLQRGLQVGGSVSVNISVSL